MKDQHYDYIDLRYGCKIVAPNGKDVFLQGDDYAELDHRIDSLAISWNEGRINKSTFPTFEDAQDALLDPYFD